MTRTTSKTAKVDSGFHKRFYEFQHLSTWLYNDARKERIDAYRKCGKQVNYNDQAGSLTEIRNEPLLSEFAKFSCHIQQNVLKRLDKAFKRFFKLKKGFPRKKKRLIRSFETYQWGKPEKIGRRTYLKIKGLGRFSFKGSMPEGCKYIRIVRTAIRVKIQFICEVANTEIRPLEEVIGIDLGITNRVAYSDGTIEKGIKLDRKKLKRNQRALSRAKKGSNNRKKKVTALAKEWERVTDKENNKLHRFTSKAVKKCNHYAMEDLKVQNLQSNPYLARNITEQQLGKIKQQLTYKAESAGGKVGLVAPHYTTRTCSECGKINPKLLLSQRVFICMYCGHSEDRDINASKNVRNKYILVSGGTVVYKQFPMSAVNIQYRRRDRGNRGTLHSEQYGYV